MKNVTKLLFIFLLTSSFVYIHDGKEKKKTEKETHVLQCSCATPGGLMVTPSGSNVILSWSPVSGAICYSYGGYYTNDGGFSGNTSSTSVTIPRKAGGTWQVRAICAGSCANPTCSGTPSSPHSF
jgi:hypothetical protein